MNPVSAKEHFVRLVICYFTPEGNFETGHLKILMKMTYEENRFLENTHSLTCLHEKYQKMFCGSVV